MPDVSYSRVNWKDSPSTDTPINSENLNKMDKGISDCAAEINNRQPKTDNNLNTTSKNTTGAINELVTAIGEVNADLSVFSFRVNSGVSEYSTDGGTTWNEFGGGTPELDYTQAVNITSTNITTTKAGAIVGDIGGNTSYGTTSILYLNDEAKMTISVNGRVPCELQFIEVGTRIKAVSGTGSSYSLQFVPYK